MPHPQEYFWLPRGDARVVSVEGDRVTLALALASYGSGAPSWDVDTFNSLKFFCLQCLVGYWSDAKHTVAVKSVRNTPKLTAAVEKHAHKDALDALDTRSSPYPKQPTQEDWEAFGAAAERIITEASITRRGSLKRTLTFIVADPGWTTHLAELRDWCLG